MNEAEKEETLDGIAIVGMSAHFPGSRDTREFWRNLIEGVESGTSLSDEDLRAAGVSSELLENPRYVKTRYEIENVEDFDNHFFDYTHRECRFMDPQHRVFLECCWEALEDAAYAPKSLDFPVGVYAGCGLNKYLIKNLLPHRGLMESEGDFLTLLSSDKDFLTTRVSYKLNLKGPSINVQTACSTSLTAIQLACQSLMFYQCDMALAGGVSLNLPRGVGYLYQEGLILSPDGHCRAFDEQAQGTVFGDGVGVVVLKRLSEALSDGDHIYAVIKGFALNNDGAEKVGFTAPSINGQAEVIASAQALASIHPETITYIEAHGTGTKLGDPIEIEGLTKAFRLQTDKTGYCAIGSVKTNIGHLDTAAGVAGLIKTALCLHHKTIPPSLNFDNPNPDLDLEKTPFYVNTKCRPWRRVNDLPLRGGISSFGVGGTNAHVIMEESPEAASSSTEKTPQVLILSARTHKALDVATNNLADFLDQENEINIADVAYTLQVGREPFSHRRAVLCSDNNNAVKNLRNYESCFVKNGTRGQTDRPVVFMFTGQGSQYVNMARDLYRQEKVFREQVDACCEILHPHLNLDLVGLMYPSENEEEKAQEQLKQTAYAQPALFTIEWALAQLWISKGVKPVAAIGHSIGEYTAACLAGVFSLDDSLRLVALRSKLMQEQPPGVMLAVTMSEQKVQPYLSEGLSIAVLNSPSNCVVSGPEATVEAFEKRLANSGSVETKEVLCHRLHTSHAFHSSMMIPALEPFKEAVQDVERKAPAMPFISNATGDWITPAQAQDPEYWSSHIRNTVRFSQGVLKLWEDPSRILLEVGPGNTLSSLARQHASLGVQEEEEPCPMAISSVRHMQQKEDDEVFFMRSLGQIWTSGGQVDWKQFHAGERRFRLSLPTYPFERERCWIDPPEKTDEALSASGAETDSVSKLSTSVENRDKIGFFSKIIGRKESHAKEQQIKTTESREYNKAELEETLSRIWKDLLGLKKIGINDDFFEIGGHSLLGAQLFAQIEKKLGCIIPLATLLEDPTIEHIAKTIREHGSESDWPSLVPIQTKGTKPPLFLIHGAEGNVLMYRDLAKHLGEDYPVYGLQSEGLDGRENFNPTIESMATRYIKEVRTIQPDGPYYLGGYCLGGTIAFEMARQLGSAGLETAYLGMFETYNLQTIPDPVPLHYRYYNSSQNIFFHLLNLFLAGRQGRWQFFRQKLNVEISRVKIRSQVAWSNIMRSIGSKNTMKYHYDYIDKVNDRAVMTYKPSITPARITLYKSKYDFAGYRDPQWGWSGLAEKGIDVQVLPIGPKGMMVEPFVQLLAEKVKPYLP